MRTSLLTAGLIGLMALHASPVMAQGERAKPPMGAPNGSTDSAPSRGKPADADWASRQFDVDFPGGTLAEFVAVVQQQVPELNVVVAQDVQDVEVQPLQLRSVVFASALAVVDELLHPRIDIEPVSGPIEATTPVILVRGRERTVNTVAFSIRNIAGENGNPNLIAAIEFAVSSLPDATGRSAPKMRTHEATGILIVTADDEQLRLIGQVVELLGGESRIRLGSQNGLSTLVPGADRSPYPQPGEPFRSAP